MNAANTTDTITLNINEVTALLGPVAGDMNPLTTLPVDLDSILGGTQSVAETAEDTTAMAHLVGIEFTTLDNLSLFESVTVPVANLATLRGMVSGTGDNATLTLTVEV